MISRTGRWEAGIAAAVLLAAIGLFDRNATLLLAAAIPLIYVIYGSLSSVRVPDSLTAERHITPARAPPGRPVSVTLTVTNEGSDPLSDVRVVDAVPESITVVDGTPRAGTTLDAGESMTVEYVVVPRRGDYDFDPPRVRIRGAGAGAFAMKEIPPEGEDRLICRLDATAPPLDDAGTGVVGTMMSDQPGRGVEFHSTRLYQTGDPASRIHWRQYAKRDTLTTVNYARQVSATVVLVIDARGPCHVVAGPGRPSAVELSAYAATHALSDILRSGNEVAVAVLGLDGPGPAGLHWLPPGGGTEQRARALKLFRTAIDGSPAEIDAREQFQELGELAPASAHLTLFTPALDGGPPAAVQAWTAFGHPVVVLSPDVVADNTVDGQVTQVRRRTRLARCQALGARTIDWRRGTPLALALEYAFTADAKLASARSTATAAGGGS